MKRNAKVLALMALMAAGVAGAQAGETLKGTTQAGTEIKNTATATYDNPATGGQITTPSNPVSTRVQAVPSFTITPNDNDGSDVANAHYATDPETTTGAPGTEAVFTYTLTNTGNVPNESYALTNTPPTSSNGGGTGSTAITAATPTFYLDLDGDKVLDPEEKVPSNARTTITDVDPGAANAKTFFVVYPIPTVADGANLGDKYGTDPTGTRQANTTYDGGLTFNLVDANNANVTTVTGTAAGVIGPNTDPNGAADTPFGAPYTSGGITITPNNSDQQTAVVTGTTTSVVFTNTIKNNGTTTDTFTLSTGSLPAGVTVTYSVPSVTLAKDATADVQVTVTFPAGYNNADITAITTITSAFDPSKTDWTTNIVDRPTSGAVFGNQTPAGTDAAPTLNADSARPDDQRGTTVSIPMEVNNTGSTAEPFTLSGTVTIPTATGSSTVPVVYLPDTNCDGTADSNTEITVTPSIAAGGTYCVIATIATPINANGGTYTVNQTATGSTTGASASDNTDTVTIPTVTGTPTVVKTVSPTGDVKPGDTLTYTITFTNGYNLPVANVMILDAVPANTKFKSTVGTVTGVTGGTVIYSKTCTATATDWTATAFTSLNVGETYCVAWDANGDTDGYKPSALPAAAKLILELVVEVN